MSYGYDIERIAGALEVANVLKAIEVAERNEWCRREVRSLIMDTPRIQDVFCTDRGILHIKSRGCTHGR